MIKVIVPISGGKDSQACAKLACQLFDPSEVDGLFCDTGFEHPMTYEHVDNIADMYGISIHKICAGSVEMMVKNYKLQLKNIISSATSGSVPINDGAGSFIVLSGFSESISDVYVYPNPIKYVDSYTQITFANLTQNAEILIFSISLSSMYELVLFHFKSP